MSRLLLVVMALASRLPLGVLQRLGILMGRVAYWCAPRFAARLRTNLENSGIPQTYQESRDLVKQTAGHTGMGGLELFIAWGRETDTVVSLVKRCQGWEAVAEAEAAGCGLIFVTPHLGNYDIAGRYLAHRLARPLTAMYRPPKLAWLEPLMNAGRARGNARTAPANAAGVRLVMKALKSHESTMILPDQAPGQGDGVWADFFGRPAYTMTLIPRLAQMDNVKVFFFYGRRLGIGEGFEVIFTPLTEPFTGDKATDAGILNRAVEGLIRQSPEQYLWSYNRYKVPRGVQPPEPKEVV